MQQAPNVRQQLKEITCINIDVHLWSGRARLRPEDIRIIQGELPPADLASLGSKKICNPDALSVFTALKKRAHRLCEERGIRFLGGYAVPKAKVKELIAELKAIGAEFKIKKQEFLDSYDQEIDDWVGKHVGWEETIRKAVEPSAEVGRRMSFDFQPFEIVPTRADKPEKGSEDKEPTEGRLGAAASRMADRLFHEVSQVAREIFDNSLIGRDEVTQRTLRPIRMLRGKLDGLAFLDPRVSPLVSSIDSVLAGMPSSGKISGTALSALHGTVFILSDVNRLKQHGEAILNGATRQADVVAEAEATQAEAAASPQTNAQALADVGTCPPANETDSTGGTSAQAEVEAVENVPGSGDETPAPLAEVSIPALHERQRRSAVTQGIAF